MTDLFETICSIPKPRRPTEPIVRDALVEGGCRWWLKRAWGAGPCILWAMCNPSDADGMRDDPTLWRIMEFSLRWDFGSLIAVNVVPRISADPAMALAWLRLKDSNDPELSHRFRDQWNKNITICAQMIAKAERHMVAWGNLLPADVPRNWLHDVVEEFADEPDGPPIEFQCLGTTAGGAPKHPLARGQHRVPSDFVPVRWSAA